TDNADYMANSASVLINVSKATPVITWSSPADITYGTALSSIQLNASATWTVNGSTVSVNGTFNYNPAAGTVLNAGNGQTLSTSFAPMDTTDYISNTATAKINVLKATPSISWANPADITYGTALSGTQLNASAAWTVNGSAVSVAGSFTYTPPTGTVLNAGSGQTLPPSFAPTDTADYITPAKSLVLKVL